MVDFTFTQAQTEELAPLVGQGEAQVETVVAKSPGVSPPLTADEVDRMYRQLAEIHAITTAQLADCACWCWIDSPPPPTWLDSNGNQLAKDRCGAIYNKVSTITSYQLLILGLAKAVAGAARRASCSLPCSPGQPKCTGQSP
jgi:hypothetical protein